MIYHRDRAINSRAPKLSQYASLQQESSLEEYDALLLTLLVAGGLFRTPLRSPVPTSRFLKFKRHSFRLNMIYISKKKSKIRRRGIKGQKPRISGTFLSRIARTFVNRS